MLTHQTIIAAAYLLFEDSPMKSCICLFLEQIWDVSDNQLCMIMAQMCIVTAAEILFIPEHNAAAVETPGIDVTQ